MKFVVDRLSGFDPLRLSEPPGAPALAEQPARLGIGEFRVLDAAERDAVRWAPQQKVGSVTLRLPSGPARLDVVRSLDGDLLAGRLEQSGRRFAAVDQHGRPAALFYPVAHDSAVSPAGGLWFRGGLRGGFCDVLCSVDRPRFYTWMLDVGLRESRLDSLRKQVFERGDQPLRERLTDEVLVQAWTRLTADWRPTREPCVCLEIGSMIDALPAGSHGPSAEQEALSFFQGVFAQTPHLADALGNGVTGLHTSRNWWRGNRTEDDQVLTRLASLCDQRAALGRDVDRSRNLGDALREKLVKRLPDWPKQLVVLACDRLAMAWSREDALLSQGGVIPTPGRGQSDLRQTLQNLSTQAGLPIMKAAVQAGANALLSILDQPGVRGLLGDLRLREHAHDKAVNKMAALLTQEIGLRRALLERRESRVQHLRGACEHMINTSLSAMFSVLPDFIEPESLSAALLGVAHAWEEDARQVGWLMFKPAVTIEGGLRNLVEEVLDWEMPPADEATFGYFLDVMAHPSNRGHVEGIRHAVCLYRQAFLEHALVEKDGALLDRVAGFDLREAPVDVMLQLGPAPLFSTLHEFGHDMSLFQAAEVIVQEAAFFEHCQQQISQSSDPRAEAVSLRTGVAASLKAAFDNQDPDAIKLGVARATALTRATMDHFAGMAAWARSMTYTSVALGRSAGLDSGVRDAFRGWRGAFGQDDLEVARDAVREIAGWYASEIEPIAWRLLEEFEH